MLKNEIIMNDYLNHNPTKIPTKILLTLKSWENNFKDKLKLIKLVGYDDFYFDEDNEIGYVEYFDFTLIIENNGFQIEVILNFREHENIKSIVINNEYCIRGLEKDKDELFHKFQWECFELSTEIQWAFYKPTLFSQPKILYMNIYFLQKNII